MVVLEPYDIKVLMLGSREVIRTRGGALFYEDEEYLFFPRNITLQHSRVKLREYIQLDFQAASS